MTVATASAAAATEAAHTEPRLVLERIEFLGSWPPWGKITKLHVAILSDISSNVNDWSFIASPLGFFKGQRDGGFGPQFLAGGGQPAKLFRFDSGPNQGPKPIARCRLRMLALEPVPPKRGIGVRF